MSRPLLTVLWRGESLSTELFGLRPGTDGGHMLEGKVFLVLDDAPTRVDYEVEVDDAWLTRRTTVRMRCGFERERELVLEADGQGHWRVDGEERPDLDGCTDVDLGVTPSTNTLPIRRLESAVAVDGSADVRAAWVRFPELAVEVLEQGYERVAPERWVYSSGDDFRAELLVDELGVVITYGADLWHTLARASD